MAYINSWAITPYLIHEISDRDLQNTDWMIPSHLHDDHTWERDTSLTVTCVESDNTIYFESSFQYQHTLTGFYVERLLTINNSFKGPVYTQIKPPREERQLYLFKLQGENAPW